MGLCAGEAAATTPAVEVEGDKKGPASPLGGASVSAVAGTGGDVEGDPGADVSDGEDDEDDGTDKEAGTEGSCLERLVSASSKTNGAEDDVGGVDTSVDVMGKVDRPLTNEPAGEIDKGVIGAPPFVPGPLRSVSGEGAVGCSPGDACTPVPLDKI